MKKQLDQILSKLDNQDANQQELGFEALAIIKEILKENPFDIDMLTLRMRLNTDIFENTTQIIEDATFIIENDQFKEDKMVGYDWLFWVYNDSLSMPDKATEVIEEQLVEMQTLYSKLYEKDEKESELLDKFAILKHNNNQTDVAIDLWYKAYKKYPYFYNNGLAGLLHLEKGSFKIAEEILLTHYAWSYENEDGYRLQYGIKLKELYDAKKLDKHPTLLGLLFNIIRNEKTHFNIEGKLDFFEKYYPEVEKWLETYPNNAFLCTAIAHTHHFDTKNFVKAYEAYSQLFNCEKHIAFTDVDRIKKSAKKSDNDFLNLPFKFKGSSSVMYNAMSSFSTIYDKTKKEKKKKKAAKIAIQYGEVGYQQYKDYLINGKGDTHNNQPHLFAMLCNNYANALGNYADTLSDEKEKEKEKLYDLAGDIHIEGYQMSPFIENIKNASSDYFKAKNYKKSIESTLTVFENYSQELSTNDRQRYFLRMVKCYVGLKDIANAEKYYSQAKKLYNKIGQGAKDAAYYVIFSGKIFYEYAVTEEKAYDKYIPEMEWFLEQEEIQNQEPKEVGLVAYYLGLCYNATNQKDKAAAAFQKTVDYLQDVDDWEFYETKCEQAEEELDALGVKVIKKKKKSKKSGFRRTIDAFLFPFMVLALLGGAIVQMLKKEDD
ncbi:hypothetical protein QSV08_09750 [Maribacter sp. BPC-D8]|uniref:hypothetical protein n=1 Tax=Maribacter sp. BPC-D8 TaxID=3053613 RepID=UPI002B46E45E|nr:hypothetical protein [Maribacter sp. BPC-D8]WRI31519.1 hypothetical protein QSV08_09750 [Maribacter sp. BPC-D8]